MHLALVVSPLVAALRMQLETLVTALPLAQTRTPMGPNQWPLETWLKLVHLLDMEWQWVQVPMLQVMLVWPLVIKPIVMETPALQRETARPLPMTLALPLAMRHPQRAQKAQPLATDAMLGSVQCQWVCL
jgi:hypothetical protein